MLEQDENEQLVAKPYNVSEANKQKQLEEEQQPKHSLVTASMLAQQQARKSNDQGANYLPANSITASNDITPSF